MALDLLRLAPHLSNLAFCVRRRPMIGIADFELFERVAERAAQPQIGFRAEANRRHKRVPSARSKWIRDLGERMHLGPPLCDPVIDAPDRTVATLLGRQMLARSVVSITQDSEPRVPVRGRHSPNLDKILDKGEAATAASYRHFALRREIGKHFVAAMKQARIPRDLTATRRKSAARAGVTLPLGSQLPAIQVSRLVRINGIPFNARKSRSPGRLDPFGSPPYSSTLDGSGRRRIIFTTPIRSASR
jgi:hypothetical protein